MADEILKRDQNHITVLAGITDDADQDIVMLRVDPITKRLLVKATGGGGGSSVSVNGVEVTDPNFIDSNTAEFNVATSDVSVDVKGVNRVVVSGNTTATLGTYYVSVATATYTDPTPAEGAGYSVLIRNGTSTIGGVAYATAGLIVHRYYHSGAWANYVLIPQGAMSGDVTQSITGATTVVSASTTVAGKVELAITSEVDTGTDAKRAVTPDGLAGSYAGTKNQAITVVEARSIVTTGDGKQYFRIPPELNGMNLVGCGASVLVTSSSGTPTIQIARGRQANATSAHSFVDMLSTRITIDVSEYDSKDATTQPVIDGANDDVLTGDLIRIDVDVAGTGTTGLFVTLSFRLP